MVRVGLMFVVVWAAVVSWCSNNHAAFHTELVGKQVVVSADPTIITTADTSQVRPRTWEGAFVSADENWVVIHNGGQMQAINRDRVVSIVEKGQ